jgi:aspartyl-tRNA(Asn)/glutamyl-tRNA(Gln) amidotransferase subunit A
MTLPNESEFLGIDQVTRLIAERKLSVTELVKHQIERIKKLNPKLNAFITITPEIAFEKALQCEQQIREHRPIGPLHGVPISVKDIIFVRNVLCTAGSKIFASNISQYDATSVAKARQNGAVIVGKNNLHEFASGVTNLNPFFGAAKNPWDTNRMTGGSSGGSAVAVSAGMVFGAIGTDTSGSVRIPASLCGVVGLKPTFGRISRYGVIPLSKTLDHVGLLARSTLDVAMMMNALSGFDPEDSGSVDRPPEDFASKAIQQLPNVTLGVPNSYFLDVLDDEVRKCFRDFLQSVGNFAIFVKDIEISNIERIHNVWAAIRFAEAAAFHRDWLRTKSNEYGEDVLRMLNRGRQFSAVEYIAAIEAKPIMEQSFLTALRNVDAMIVPTTPIVAPPIEAKSVNIDGMNYDIYSILSRLTLPFNVVGLPALTIPIGLSRDSMPIGAQIVGRPFEESLIFRLGHHFETKLGRFRPPHI